MKETFGKKSTSSKFLQAQLQMAHMGHGTFNSNKIYFVIIT